MLFRVLSWRFSEERKKHKAGLPGTGVLPIKELCYGVFTLVFWRNAVQ